jgi:hypothetical protein
MGMLGDNVVVERKPNATQSLDSLLKEQNDLRSELSRTGLEAAEAKRALAELLPLESDLSELKAAHQSLLTEREAEALAKAAAPVVPKWMDKVVRIGTMVVLAAVSVQVFVGGAWSAHYKAGLSWILALLVPIAIEAGAAVELTSLFKNRILGLKSSVSSYVLTAGLMVLSIGGMVLHALDAPTKWGIVLAIAFPIELSLVVVAALPKLPKKEKVK